MPSYPAWVVDLPLCECKPSQARLKYSTVRSLWCEGDFSRVDANMVRLATPGAGALYLEWSQVWYGSLPLVRGQFISSRRKYGTVRSRWYIGS